MTDLGYPGNQRWRSGRASYRRPDEPIRTHEYEVSSGLDKLTAQAFVEEHHYSRSFPGARFRFGLHRHGELVGTAIFSQPMRNEVLTRVYPGDHRDSTDLGRFVLLDEVPGNGETWFIARCFEVLRRDECLRGAVAFSDPMPRFTLEGRMVMPGHVGTIYQASNAHLLERSRPDTLLLLPDGRSLCRRSLAKSRSGDSRWRVGVDALIEAGATPPRCRATDVPDAAELGPWCDLWEKRLTRRFRHPGNYRYAFPFSKADRKRLQPNPGEYPKRERVA